MQMHISYITKIKFFAAFKNAFIASFGEANVREGFRGTGLIPFNPETVISKLDIAPCFTDLMFGNDAAQQAGSYPIGPTRN
jgi:hypothetical protein